MGELTVDLNAPGMTALHRAGVAGLYMTVRSLLRRKKTPPGWVGAETTRDRVTLRWDGPAKSFFDALIKESYGIAKDGMVDFAAIDRAKASTEARWVVHEGMFGTFCQFGPTNGLGPKKIAVFKVGEEEQQVLFEYRPVDASASKSGKSYPHRDAGGGHIGEAIDKRKNVQLAGWLFPGAMVRHNAFKNETTFDEDPARALALVYAPVGCFFYKLRSRRTERKARYALLVPAIDDLAVYAEAREAAVESARVGDVVSTGAGEAALRLLTRLRARSLADEKGLPRVSVIVFGIVVWNEKQKSRTGRMEVEVRSDAVLRRFEDIRASLPEKAGKATDGSTFVVYSASLELFADNIAQGRPFFEGFTSLVLDKEIRKRLKADRKGLAKIVANERVFDEAAQKLFVETCHEALRRNYAIVGERAKGDQVKVGDRLTKEYDRWRYAFARSKNVGSFREALMDFWSRAGSNSVLRERWKDVMPLFTPERWKLGRDLALLALASYAKSVEANEDASDGATVEEEDH